mgnify:CR=1 FL=1
MSEFVYDENHKNHILNGKKIGSVSDIVEPVSKDYSKAHPRKLERKRDLGTAFHECIRLFLRDDLDEDSIDEDLIIPMRQFKEFWTGDGDKEPNAIYDWKLRRYDPVCDPLRMVGYEGLTQHLTSDVRIIEEAFCNEKLKYCGKPDMITGKPPRKLIVVEFSLDAGYRPRDADKKQAWPMFRKLLEWYWKKQEFENLLENWRKSI